jgi:hypothetical protein
MNLQTYATEAEWLAARKEVPHSIGGSDVAAIMDRSPESWGAGPWTLWARAQGLPLPGFTPAERADLARGQRWERHILTEWADAEGVELTLSGRRAIVRSEAHPWAAFSPDDIAMYDDRNVLVEVKTARNGAGSYPEHGADLTADEATAQIPAHYLLQILWGLHLTGLASAVLLVCIPRPGDWPETRAITIHADPAIQADLFAEVSERRERWLVNGERPPTDGSADCRASLSALFPGRPDKPMLTATGEARQLALDLAAMKAERDVLDKRISTASNELLAAIGDAYGMTVDPGTGKIGKVLAIRSAGRRTLSLSRIERDAPDLYTLIESRGLIDQGEPSTSLRTYGL